MPSPMQEPFYQSTCEHCSYGTMQLPSSGQEWHLVCTECGAILFCYVPMDHQEAFHADTHKFRMYAGGFG